MRHNKSLGFFSALVGMLVLTGSSTVAPITFQPESKLWVDGTSTVRAFSCKASTLKGEVAANAAATTLTVSDLEGAVRTVDVVSRYGGEEFVVILPETSPQGAETFAERLRMGIEAHLFTMGSLEIRLTVSIGISTFPAADISSADDFIARADQAMYRAKQDGRNQVRS